ncbi:hypothetical protein BD414DRAFT_521402, partial [Trametes punicea]
MTKPPSITQELQNLRFVLEHLPESLPEPVDSRFRCLVGYSADPEDVEDIGSVPGAVNRALEITFGWEARSKGSLPITERGVAICGLVDALRVYQQACDEPETDAILHKWCEDIAAGAREAYRAANKEFPPSGLPFPGPRDACQVTQDGADSMVSPVPAVLQTQLQTVASGRKRKASVSLEEISDDEEKDNPSTSIRGAQFSDLVDIPWRSHEAVGSGRPVKEETRMFAIKCHDKESGKMHWRCLGPRCTFFRAGPPQPKRVLKHAMVCRAFSVDNRRKANEYAAAYSLGAKLGEVQNQEAMSSGDAVGGASTRAGKSSSGRSQSGASMAASGVLANRAGSQPKQMTLGGSVLATGREELKTKLDFHIVKLICVRGLVPNTIDSQEWKDFMLAANPRYKPTSSSTFADVHIPAEAAKIRILQIKFLQQQTHLTLTYDGATTQKPQSVYTIHITTQDRRVFFIDGAELSRDLHTAQKVKEILLE